MFVGPLPSRLHASPAYANQHLEVVFEILEFLLGIIYDQITDDLWLELDMSWTPVRDSDSFFISPSRQLKVTSPLSD